MVKKSKWILALVGAFALSSLTLVDARAETPLEQFVRVMMTIDGSVDNNTSVDSYDTTLQWIRAQGTGEHLAAAAVLESCRSSWNPAWEGMLDSSFDTSYGLPQDQRVFDSKEWFARPWYSCLASRLLGSAQAVSPLVVRTEVTRYVANITQRIAFITRPNNRRKENRIGTVPATGLAGGDEASKNGLWANINHTHAKEKDDAGFSADLDSALLGYDRRFAGEWLSGITAGFQRDRIRPFVFGGDTDKENWTIAPYLAWQPREDVTTDFTFGYTHSSMDGDSEMNSQRFFGAVGLNGYKGMDDWLFSGRLGYLFVREDPEELDHSDLGQLSVGGEVSYTVGIAEPFVGAAYEYDTTYDRETLPEYDRDGVLLRAGSHFNGGNGFLGDLEASTLVGRENQSEWSAMANVRFEF